MNRTPSPLVIASWNIHKCVGTDRAFNPERTATVIGEIDPDIIALQEVDTRFGERRGLLDLKALERDAGLHPVPLPERRRAHGWHGNIILYRPAGAHGGRVRKVHPVDLPGLEPRGALVAEFEMQGSPLRVIAAHLGLMRTSRRQQVRTLLDYVDTAEPMATVLLGDLNEWRLGRSSGLKTLSGSFDAQTTIASFPARMPILALDRIMGSHDGLVRDLQTHTSPLARVASDHLPLKAQLSLPISG